MGELPVDKVASTLRDAIPFQFDTIVTRTGSSVTERRGTAWVTEQGIGALAYSGKLMPPRPIPNVVRETMRLVEQKTMNDGPYFDCALCNHYPDGEAACKFHTDPEHGSVWERLTCVVAAGDERRFAFRPIPGTSLGATGILFQTRIQRKRYLQSFICSQVMLSKCGGHVMMTFSMRFTEQKERMCLLVVTVV